MLNVCFTGAGLADCKGFVFLTAFSAYSKHGLTVHRAGDMLDRARGSAGGRMQEEGDMAGTLGNSIPGAILHEDTVVAAGEPWSARIQQGDMLRLVDLEGRQAIDFLCYSAADHIDRYSAANTMKLNKNIYLGQGSVLWSMRAHRMMTIVEDTCASAHDTLYGCCSIEIDEIRYGKTKTRSCQSNFESELAKHGMGARDMAANINFFMSAPVAPDGAVAIVESLSQPGDHVDLRAEMDVLVVLSNCPERDNAASGDGPTPIRAMIYTPG